MHFQLHWVWQSISHHKLSSTSMYSRRLSLRNACKVLFLPRCLPPVVSLLPVVHSFARIPLCLLLSLCVFQWILHSFHLFPFKAILRFIASWPVWPCCSVDQSNSPARASRLYYFCAVNNFFFSFTNFLLLPDHSRGAKMLGVNSHPIRNPHQTAQMPKPIWNPIPWCTSECG